MAYFEAKKSGGSASYTTWLSSAGISPDAYQSLDDVLKDEVAIRRLMTIHASVDAISKMSYKDIRKIINNDLCAKWINLRDYALDTLYSDEDIKGVMDSADKYGYGEWVLAPQVPTMTSNTAPFGEAFGNSKDAGNGREYWQAFMQKDSGNVNFWATSMNDAKSPDLPSYIGYKFVNPICARQINFQQIFEHNGIVALDTTMIIQGSNDGETYTDIKSVTLSSEDDLFSMRTIKFENKNSYLCYRLYFTSPTVYYPEQGNYFAFMYSLQFYAWQPKGNVPVMTSETSPYGEVFESDSVSGYEGWKVFNGIEDLSASIDNVWATSIVPSYVGYKFTNPICIRRIRYLETSNMNRNDIDNSTMVIQGSNDGETYDNIVIIRNYAINTNIPVITEFENNRYYLYYRCYFSGGNLYNSSTIVTSLQFYGRELKVSVPTMTSNTQPWGEASETDVYRVFQPYYAFDGDDSTYSSCNGSAPGVEKWVQYKFPHPTCVKQMDINIGTRFMTDAKLYASNDGENFVKISDIAIQDLNETNQSFEIINNTPYLYYRFAATPAPHEDGIYILLIMTLQFYGLNYSEYDWDSENPRHYLYDHGVEVETITTIGAVTKGDYALTLSAVDAQGIKTISLTNYNLLRGVVGEHMSGTTQLIADTTATANMTAANAPYNEFLDISAVSASLATGAKMAAAGICDVVEMWLE